MAIPLSYSMRNLWKRRLTTILTVSGMALVVFVFAAVLLIDRQRQLGINHLISLTGATSWIVPSRYKNTYEHNIQLDSLISNGYASCHAILSHIFPWRP